MGVPGPCEKAVLFIGALFSRKAVLEIAEPLLAAQFGPVFFRSREIPWGYSRYYDGEMGTPLSKVFLFFEPLIDTAGLAGIKLLTNEMEVRLSEDGRRRVNLDPGYLTLAKVVLATTKNNAHRLCLGRGIYGEVTLLYREGRFHPLPYTYPDYHDETVLETIHGVRGLLKERGMLRP